MKFLDLKELYLELLINKNDKEITKIIKKIDFSDYEINAIDINWLVLCLNQLDDKNTITFLKKIRYFLKKIINNSHNLSIILSLLNKDISKISIIKFINKIHLFKIIRDANNLIDILPFLYNSKSQKEFLIYLWKNKLINIFSQTNEIIMVLHYLSDENKELLLDKIWLDWAKRKIKNSHSFLQFFRWLTIADASIFLDFYTIDEIKKLFNDNDDFYNFLLRLDIEKRNLLFKKLNIYYVWE